MQSSLIYSLHNAPTLMRSISATVIVTFTMLILTPTVVAAQTELDKTAQTSSSTNTINSAESKLSQTLQAVESQLQQMKETSSQPQARAKQLQRRQKSSPDSLQTLQNLKQQLITLDKEVLANFQQIESELLEHQLPQVILDRHQQTVDRYRTEINQLLNELDNVTSAKSDTDRLNKVQKVINHLKAKQNKPTHQKLDPKHLPFQASENKVRPPKETPEELEQLIQIDKPVQLAALELTGAMLAQASPSLTPNDEDLLPTEDVQITEEIKALAEQLEHQPVKIFNWVRNNIEYLPTYGSIQGSQMTLDNQRGNAFDTSSLLIALLRASNIPARYAYGTVQIPIEKVMNWVGGVDSPIAALELILQGGIPASGLAEGGVIKFSKMEHIWVEAWVDFYPSRGAKNKTGDSWIPMDASFKQYEYFPGLDTNAINELDNEAITQWMQKIQSNPAEGWSNGFDINSFETLLTTSEDILDAYFEQIEYQFFVDKTRIIEEPPVLASGLPYSLIARSSATSSLPASMRLYLKYALYASETDRVLDNPVYSYKESLPKLAGKQISIGFKPASDNDRAIIESYLPVDTTGEGISVDQLPTTLPAYLVRVNAQLKLDGQEVAGGGTFTLGQELSSVTSITKVTGGWHHAVNHPVAGEYYALGIDLQGISDKQHRKQPVTTVDSILHQTAIAYFSNADAFLENLRSTKLAITYRLPSFGLFGSSLSTIYNFGIPRFVKITRTQFDVDAAFHMIVTPKNNKNQQLSITRQIGMHISALEHQIPQVYLANNEFPGQAVSTISAIAKALAQGQRIYSITATNINTVLSSLNHSVAVKNDIRNAINAGMEAVIPQNEIQIGNWNGSGYMLIEPKTGSAAYRINGGSNGMSMDNEISTAVSTAGIFGGADIHINWPEVSADDGECGEGDNIQVPLMDMLTFYILMGWLLSGAVLTNDSDCDCEQPAFNVTATLLLWFRDMNAALTEQEGCPVFISGINASFKTGLKPMWTTTQHIAKAQSNKSPKRLTWIKREERSLRQNENKDECKKGGSGQIAFIKKWGMTPSECDEYPFNSTLEGDPVFYYNTKTPLSLQLVPASHNSGAQGNVLNWFYSKCGIRTKHFFDVETDLEEGSISRGYDTHGVQCYP